MAITVKEITYKNIWEKFVLSYVGANFLQSFNWGLFHQNLGKIIIRLGFFSGKKLVGVCLCIVEKAKRATYLTIPGGPLIDWEDLVLVSFFKQTIERAAKEQNCSFVRVRSQILENEKNNRLFEKLGFKSAPMHLHAELTHQLYLKKSEDELLAAM